MIGSCTIIHVCSYKKYLSSKMHTEIFLGTFWAWELFEQNGQSSAKSPIRQIKKNSLRGGGGDGYAMLLPCPM